MIRNNYSMEGPSEQQTIKNNLKYPPALIPILCRSLEHNVSLRDSATEKKALIRILILTVLFTGVGLFIVWDHSRVNRDFSTLKVLLLNTRYQAISENKTLVARFVDRQVVITDKETGKTTAALNIPTLDQINYNTTLGKNMIVFYGLGTSAYNKRIHGGDIRLKSWLGYRKNIAVNCTGYVYEGVYPAE